MEKWPSVAVSLHPGDVPLENGYSFQRRFNITLRGSPQYTPL